VIIDTLKGIPACASLVAPFVGSINPNLVWQDGSLPWNENPQTVNGTTSSLYQLGDTQANGFGSTITLNSSMLQNSSLF